jgi:hypothetical protein
MAAGAMAMSVGCTPPAGDDDSADTSPTPTPEPPFNDNFRVTSIAVGSSTQGVDIDGDGTIDNGIEATLEEVNAAIVGEVETVMCGADGTPDCTFQQDQILGTIETLLNTVLNIETLSEALNAPVQEGSVNYITNFAEQANGDVNLEWWTAEFKSVGFTLVKSLGKQAGKLDDSGNGKFGPGELAFTIEITNPQSGETIVEQKLTMRQGYTVVAGYNPELLNNMYTGGAIAMQDILDLVEQILVTVNDLIPDPDPTTPDEENDIPIDDTLLAIDTSLAPYADITLTDGSTGFSIGLVAKAEVATVN